ncbi:hypothetical protein AVEN_152406-1 [Araneus ventricosus]|uniref:Uncharacterized protein n=1 Tax=Araneus ventricosus TaxID=182803 RepID=A0A4Y2TK14_ARAVE|nr:hypothetical protein AVEN_152406-1 [Araneus ventricosus]
MRPPNLCRTISCRKEWTSFKGQVYRQGHCVEALLIAWEGDVFHAIPPKHCFIRSHFFSRSIIRSRQASAGDSLSQQQPRVRQLLPQRGLLETNNSRRPTDIV